MSILQNAPSKKEGLTGSGMQNFLERFGSNFIVAAFIPALTFVTAGIILFGPLLFSGVANGLLNPLDMESIFSSFGKYWVLIFLLSIMVGFSLSSLNNFILKVAEGYVLLEHFPALLRAEKRRAQKIAARMNRATRRANHLDSRASRYVPDSVLYRRYENLSKKVKLQNYALASEYQRAFPIDENEIMPTRFGNTLKAAEYYPLDRYGIDAVVMWPRLISVIRNDYMTFIDQAHNGLSFIINSGVLCLIFGVVSFPLSLYLWLTRTTQGQAFNLWFYLGISLASFAAAYVFHRASLFSVSEYGEMIRSAYDLFRIPLMQALHIKPEVNSRDEKESWSVVCEFIKIGEYGGEMSLDYEVPQTEHQDTSNASDSENNDDSSTESE